MSARSATRSGLGIATWEGVMATVHLTLTTGGFLTGYVLLLGANDFQLALVSALPLLAQLAQIPGAYLVERVGQRKWITGVGALLGRLFWLPLALLPFLTDHPMLPFLMVYGLSSIFMNLAGPAWVGWMSDLVPRRVRGRYFGSRNKAVGVATLVSSLVAGFLLDRLRAGGQEGLGFLLLQSTACGAAVAAFVLILKQPDPGYRLHQLPSVSEFLVRPFRDPVYRRILYFFFYWIFAVGLSAPFFSAHLLKHLGWDFKGLAYIAVASSIVSILVHPLWGRAIDRHGHKPVLVICSVGILHLPLYYAFCPAGLDWPIYVNAVLAGLFWSGFNLAVFNLVMSAAPGHGRPGYVAAYSAASGVVNFLASLCGGGLAYALAKGHVEIGGRALVNYQVIFLFGSLARLPGFWLLARIREPGAKRTVVLVRQLFSEIDRRIAFGRQVLTLPSKRRGGRGGVRGDGGRYRT